MTAVHANNPNAPRPVGRYEWESVLRRVTLPDDLKFAALLLGTYADPDGTRVRPGEPELAAALGKSKPTVRRRVSALQEMGFVRLVSRGGGRGPAARASVYRLTLPIDLLDRFEVRPPSGGRRFTSVTPLIQGERSSIENSAQPRVSAVPNEATETQLTPGVSAVPDTQPVDNSETQLTHGERSSSEADPKLRSNNAVTKRNSAQIDPKLRSPMGERPPATPPATQDHRTNPDPAQPDTAVDKSEPPNFHAESRAADPDTCAACSTYLDPDGTCFVCRAGRRTQRGHP